jgi:hypothetical protein
MRQTVGRLLDNPLLVGDDHLGERSASLERRPAEHFVADSPSANKSSRTPTEVCPSLCSYSQ